MSHLEFSEAIDLAVRRAMAEDDRVVVFGEDVPMIRRELVARFGPRRILAAPISESAFVGAAVGAALGGLRPIVEVQLVDFLPVAMSALVNEAAKVEAFSGGTWTATDGRPRLLRRRLRRTGVNTSRLCGGCSLQTPGLAVVAPSCPADGAGLMRAAIEHDGPVIFLEHKLLSAMWLEWMGGSRRSTVSFDLPPEGVRGEVDDPPPAVSIGRAVNRREGPDLTIVSLAVGVHRSLEAAGRLAEMGIESTVIDARSVAPLDRDAIAESARRTGRVLRRRRGLHDGRFLGRGGRDRARVRNRCAVRPG